MKQRVYVVCPNPSSYKNKDENEKRRIKNLITNWYNKLVDYGYRITMFAEDMLAVELFHEESNIIWKSAITKSDYNFLVTVVEDYPRQYLSTTKDVCDTDIVALSVSKFKTVRLKDFETSQEYRAKRFQTLSKRIRYVANEVLEEAKFVLYFDANNNFCNCPEPKWGDGRKIIRQYVTTEIAEFTLGGIPLNKDDFEEIMKNANT